MIVVRSVSAWSCDRLVSEEEGSHPMCARSCQGQRSALRASWLPLISLKTPVPHRRLLRLQRAPAHGMVASLDAAGRIVSIAQGASREVGDIVRIGSASHL